MDSAKINTIARVLGDQTEQNKGFSITDWVISLAIVVTLVYLLRRKTNMALAILGLCAGYFFQAFLGADVLRFVAGSGYKSSDVPLVELINGIIVFTPALLIVWRFSGHQSGRILLQMIPALAFCLLGLILLVDILPQQISSQLEVDSRIVSAAVSNEMWIAIASVMVAVVDVLVLEASRDRRHKKVKKHHSKLRRK